MERIVIDLGKLLEDLRALDLKTASVDELTNLFLQLERVKDGMASAECLPEEAKPYLHECMEFHDRIQEEFDRRDIHLVNIWDMLAEHPEILIESLEYMPLLDLIALEENLRAASSENEDVAPLHEIALEILCNRLKDCPSC